MYDAGKVVIGLIIFIVLITFPIWYNVATGNPGYRPELAKVPPDKGSQCVADVEYMRSSHMDLLNDWREKVVRTGERIYVTHDGREFNMSLTQTCLDCHTDRKAFCDNCHDYMAVEPYCWDCHFSQQELTR